MTYRGAGKQPPTPTSTLTVRDDEQENRRYWFARHCYKHRREIAPSGRTWEEAFHRLEGFSLRDYMQFSKKNKLGEKYGIQNKSR
jgi:hypothetical protein